MFYCHVSFRGGIPHPDALEVQRYPKRRVTYGYKERESQEGGGAAKCSPSPVRSKVLTPLIVVITNPSYPFIRPFIAVTTPFKTRRGSLCWFVFSFNWMHSELSPPRKLDIYMYILIYLVSSLFIYLFIDLFI